MFPIGIQHSAYTITIAFEGRNRYPSINSSQCWASNSFLIAPSSSDTAGPECWNGLLLSCRRVARKVALRHLDLASFLPTSASSLPSWSLFYFIFQPDKGIEICGRRTRNLACSETSSHRESGPRNLPLDFRLHALWIRIAALSRISASCGRSPSSEVFWRRFR